jgi:poly(3-hydroxybutyrate) depolymerase
MATGSGGQATGSGGSALDAGPGRPDSATPATGGTAAGGTTGGTGGVGAGGSTGNSTGLAGPAVPSEGCGKATTAKSGNNQTISVKGSNRTYNLAIPSNYDMNKAYRLIISYHWLNGTAANVSDGSSTAAAWYGQNTSSTGGGSTIFVAPQGLNNGWSNSGGADVEFSKALITQLESQLCVDKARIFCEGFSMGGSMSYAMASAAPEIIRAVAVHSGGNMSGSTNGHNKPVAYFMTHGTKDSVCTWPGFGLPQLQDFAKVNGCKTPDPTASASAFQSALPQPSSNKGVCLDFTGCTEGFPTRSCLFVGDHTPSPDGTTGWVPKETWSFFSKF